MLFRSDANSLQGWHLDHEQQYQPLTPNENGWLWCRRLGLWLGTWEGTVDRETAIWARFYDVAGNLVLLPEEAAQLEAENAQLQAQEAQVQAQEAQAQAQEAQAKAARLAARLLELGENPDIL